MTFALVGALSLFIGAFIASAAAALGGRLRDDNEGASTSDRQRHGSAGQAGVPDNLLPDNPVHG